MPKIISREEALKKGLKYFFTGKECKNGHLAQRRTSNGNCIDCAYLRNLKYTSKPEIKVHRKKLKSDYDKRPDRKIINRQKQKAYQNKLMQTEEGRKIISERARLWRISEKGKESTKRYLSKPEVIEKRNQYKRDWYKSEVGRESMRKYYEKKFSDPEVLEEKRRKNREYTKTDRFKELAKIRVNTPEGKLNRTLRAYLYKSLKKADTVKALKLIELTGKNIKELKLYLEEQFQSDMSWKNHGEVWHIDHIVPIQYFVEQYDYTKPEIQKICWHYSNLQPLYAFDNISKSGRINKKIAEKKIREIKKLIDA